MGKLKVRNICFTKQYIITTDVTINTSVELLCQGDTRSECGFVKGPFHGVEIQVRVLSTL